MKKLIICVLIILVAYFMVLLRENSSEQTNKKQDIFDTKRYSINASDSPWIIVNKQRPLNPNNYVPNELSIPDITKTLRISPTESNVSRDTGYSLKALFLAAKKDDVKLQLESGYRSYVFQQNLYNRYVSEQGQDSADRESARAGFSEHQTGLAVDVGSPETQGCNIKQCFADTNPGLWLVANAHKYGFIIRYPKNQEITTGYTYEPWHIRYVGTYLSLEMKRTNTKTLESFFNLPNAAQYRP